MVQSEVRRKQVAIAGTVINTQTTKTIDQVLITITDAPDAFVSKLLTRIQLITLPSQQQEALKAVLDATSNAARLTAILELLQVLPASYVTTIFPKRLERTYSTEDGSFYFTDLPNGEYTLTASLPKLGRRFGTDQQNSITVARDADGNLLKAEVELSLPPTTIKGQIVAEADRTEKVILAEIRIQGSGEITYSDAQGNYLLTELETSPQVRIVEVKALGFQPNIQEILLNEVGSEQSLDFALKKLPSFSF